MEARNGYTRPVEKGGKEGIGKERRENEKRGRRERMVERYRSRERRDVGNGVRS